MEDTFLNRAGGSLAKFAGTALGEIKLVGFTERRGMILEFLAFLKAMKDAGHTPNQAAGLVDAFTMIADTPQVIAGGTMEVAGQIRNVNETEFGIDIGIEFAAPALPFAGASAGIDIGGSYRSLQHEATSQNFKAMIRWAHASGPVKMTTEAMTNALATVLADPTLEIPTVDEERVNEPSDLLTSQVIPFLTGLFAPKSDDPEPIE